ncbi:hypothetical protein GQ43DRAFT_434837 [Delitschia confertaspora ATCC 74209]|uniref:Uncharacterized protein n=1 Tax=Delitschia confertaspora ATCC 74209 TaxID=1513339 RepID=A0A9P4MM22_9PLEO|nr:hypothetical protein GQ43DRAFT_434837 [Delitschia confertaspora ATCC 74209]
MAGSRRRSRFDTAVLQELPSQAGQVDAQERRSEAGDGEGDGDKNFGDDGTTTTTTTTAATATLTTTQSPCSITQSDKGAIVAQHAPDRDGDTSMPSPPPEGSNQDASQLVQGVCKNPKCEKVIGEFFNSWHSFTSSYFLPSLPGSYNCKLEKRDKPKTANRDTALRGW